jgi:hypothetical protein
MLTWRVLAVAATRVAAAAKKASRSHRKEIKKDSIRGSQKGNDFETLPHCV